MKRRKTKKVLAIALIGMVAIAVFAGGPVIAQVEQPDLIITELKWTPLNPVDGETITIDTTVKNIGTATVTTDFYVGFYIDGDYYTRVWITQDLAPGESTYSSSIQTTWAVTPHDHDIKAWADYANYITESDETNNTLTKHLYVEPSDLIITDLTWTHANPDDGETITIDATVKNIGTGKTIRDFYVGFYIDGDYYTRVWITQDLAPGESTYSSSIQTTWAVTPHDHDIKAWADYANYITESDETNNTLTKHLYVEPSDLIITDLTWTPTNPEVGETITIDTTVKNIGTGKTIRDFYVGFYIDGVYYKRVWITQDLAPGESTYSSSIQTTWAVTPHDHDIKAWADYANYITESDETNNQKTEHLPPLTPMVSIWTDKEEYKTGEIMQVNIRIRNPSDSSVTFNWYLGVPKFQLPGRGQ